MVPTTITHNRSFVGKELLYILPCFEQNTKVRLADKCRRYVIFKVKVIKVYNKVARCLVLEVIQDYSSNWYKKLAEKGDFMYNCTYEYLHEML